MKYSDQFIQIGNTTVKQVNKVQAKKLYDNGKQIYLHACNMRLNNAWQSPMPLDNSQGEKFSTMVNEFEYYNCCNERGKYSNFFVNL